jgi:outer membrane protein OmpA-like peptidoglycan-associated protein
LTASATAKLNALLPKLRTAKIVIVYGFASGKGAIAITRSAARAAAVASYLTAHGVTVASSAGYGSSIAPAAKATMERVDIGFA